jgi:hypothetical protein
MRKDKTKISSQPISRRGFIKTAVAGGAAMAAGASQAESDSTREHPRQVASGDQLEELLLRHGSEFGDIRRTQ